MKTLASFLFAMAAATVCRGASFDSAQNEFLGVRPVRDVYGKRRTAGLGWHVFVDNNLCRLGKPPVVCKERMLDLNPKEKPLVKHQWLPTMTDHGMILPGAGNARLNDIESLWTSATFLFETDAGDEFKVTVSRLTPAVLVETGGSSISLFSGSRLKIFAMAHSGVFTAYDFTAGPVFAEDLDAGWLLAWHGKDGATCAAGADPTVHTRWDFPVLVVFGDTLEEIAPEDDGSVVFNFTEGEGGAVALMPLLGDRPVLASPAKRHSGEYIRDFRAADLPPTSEWLDGLPEAVVERCKFWAQRLGMFPMDARDTCEFDEDSAAVTVFSVFTFRRIRENATLFAPLPAMLAAAYAGGMPVKFSDEPLDSGLVTSYGPYLGIEGVESYSYSLPGLGRYALERREFGPPDAVPPELQSRLNEEIDKALDAGIMAPWLQVKQLTPAGKAPDYTKEKGRLIHGYPGENLYFIAQLMECADDARKEKLRGLMAEWEEKYPCLEKVHMPADQDARREADYIHLPLYAEFPDKSVNFHYIYKIPPADALYCWDAYNRAMGLTPDHTAGECIEPYLQRIDWATGSSFQWDEHARLSENWGTIFEDKDFGWSGTADANRLFSGLVGYIRLSRATGDAAAEAQGWYFLAKTAVLRVALEKYRYFLYGRNLAAPPADPMRLKRGIGHYLHLGSGFHTFQRNGPDDDPLAVYICDEFGITVAEGPSHYWTDGRLPAYYGLVPESGRLLRDHAAREAAAYCAIIETSTPDWYIVFGENNTVPEAYCHYPGTVYSIFCAHAWALEQPPELLLKYADLSWLARGDWFYMHKLAETIKAFRKPRWTPMAP